MLIMNAEELIKQVEECRKNNWQNSDLGSGSEKMLEAIAEHFETCDECRKDFDAMDYPEKWLIDFEERLSGTSLSDWIHEDIHVHEFKIYGIEAVEKKVTSGSGHSARINVPPSWQGKRVMVVRLE
jgi:putative transposon-encoded protein